MDESRKTSESRVRKCFAVAGLAAAVLSLSARSDERDGDPPRLERTPGGFGPAEDGRERSEPLLEKQGWVYVWDGRPDPRGGALSLWREPRSLPERPAEPEGPSKEGATPAVRLSSGPDGTRLRIEPGPGRTIELPSRQSFWDFDLHVEISGTAYLQGSLLLRGRHEIALSPTPRDRPREELDPADMGGVGKSPPAENACRGPDEWQALDVSIRGYRVSVRLNGVPVQTDLELLSAGDPRTPGPLVLRVSAGALEIRSVRVRPRPTPAIWRNPPAQG